MKQAFNKLWIYAITILQLVLVGCATGSDFKGRPADFHVRSAPEDFAALGLHPTDVAKWEDGRRLKKVGGDNYEWWYFDGMLDDGTIIVAIMGENYVTPDRYVILEITPPAQETRKVLKSYKEAGQFSFEQADVKIGKHAFVGDLNSYHIVVDPSEADGLGVDLHLTRQTPSYRPATGHVRDGQREYGWVVAVPNGEVTGTMTVDGVVSKVHGSGYHDHNWGDIFPKDILDNWWWGRAVVSGHTIIVAEMRAKGAPAEARIPYFFVTTSDKVLVNAFSPATVKVVEGEPTAAPDPAHSRSIGSKMTFTTSDGIESTFNMSNKVLTSFNIVESLPWYEKAAAKLLGKMPWYTRVVSPVTLKLPGGNAEKGQGVLELFELQ